MNIKKIVIVSSALTLAALSACSSSHKNTSDEQAVNTSQSSADPNNTDTSATYPSTTNSNANAGVTEDTSASSGSYPSGVSTTNDTTTNNSGTNDSNLNQGYGQSGTAADNTVERRNANHYRSTQAQKRHTTSNSEDTSNADLGASSSGMSK